MTEDFIVPRTDTRAKERFLQFVIRLVLDSAFRTEFKNADAQGKEKKMDEYELTPTQKAEILRIDLDTLEATEVQNLHQVLDGIDGYKGPTIRG